MAVQFGVAEVMQGLGDRPFQGQSLRHVINSEASAKLYSSNRRKDLEHNLARQYAKAWLAIHAIESNSSPSSIPRPVPRTAVHDSGLAGVMLGPGRGQLIPVANTVPASPSAPTVRLMEPTVKFVMLRSLWSTAQLGFSTLPQSSGSHSHDDHLCEYLHVLSLTANADQSGLQPHSRSAWLCVVDSI